MSSFSYHTAGLPDEDAKAVDELLSRLPHNPPTVEDIWKLIDSAWDDLGCDNKNPDWDKIGLFYRHPVWIVNALFVEQDEISLQHRHAISDWIAQKNLSRVLDYGGGGGTLASLIASKDANVTIDIYEPYPSSYALSRAAGHQTVHLIDTPGQNYDCITSIDVLEHVPDPLQTLSEMVALVRGNGYLLIANHFWPVIKCHLPSTFHFRYTFRIFTNLMGLELLGPCEGSHANIYRKKKEVLFDWRKMRRYERVSRVLFPLFQTVHFPLIILEKFLKHVG
jgi:ubiquinone/menaquinone biosynthesis C-methylase UbiE